MMKDFNFKRFLIAVVVMYIVIEFLGFLIHAVMLRPIYEALTEVWRPNYMEKMWMMYIFDFVFVVVFVYLFHFFSKGYYKSGWVKGACYGFLIGLLFFSSYILHHVIYPIPMSLAFRWFVLGLIVSIVCGIVVALIYKPRILKSE